MASRRKAEAMAVREPVPIDKTKRCKAIVEQEEKMGVSRYECVEIK